jgi:hypothetical protein
VSEAGQTSVVEGKWRTNTGCISQISFTRHKSPIQSMRAFYCCTACIVVIDAEKIDRSLVNLYSA